MADSRWIYTPIGGGKTAFSVLEFYKELERTERFCVNNLPVIYKDPPPKYFTAGEFCHQFIAKPVDLQRRCFYMTYDQAREFWRYMPIGDLQPEDIEKYKLELIHNVSELGDFTGVKMPNKPHPLYKEVCDFTLRTDPDSPHFDGKSGHPRGCYYQLDECHKLFAARFWQMLGPQSEDYTSELRKFNDDVDWITQHPEKVDKNLRRNATSWVQVTNLSKTRLFMGVSIKNSFRFYGYDQVDMPSKSDKPTYSGGFKMNQKKKFEYTYLTMQGQSVHGGTGTEESRYKGKSPFIWLLAIIGIFVAAHYLPITIETIVTHAVSATTTGFQKGMQDGMQGAMPKPSAQSPINTNVLVQPQTFVPSPPVFHPRVETIPPVGAGDNSIFCTGWAGVGTNIFVTLSDGRICRSDRGEVQGVGDSYVKVLGLPKMPIHGK